MNCIETKNLSYNYSKEQVVLNDLNLQVPTGSIYGFLGPNGAGKTTTLRLILGLLKQQQGEITVFNKPFAANRIDILRNTGSLIESPSLYGHLTAMENLEVLRKIYRSPQARIQEVLQLVGLENTGSKKAGSFSLGMKQRLSIAIALLHEPSLLILDEPTNGLDPNGIIEIRELLKRLNAEKKTTIVISSHLLSEIEKMVTHVGIINKGTLLFQGTLEELNIRQNLTAATCFETNHPIGCLELILAKGLAGALSGGHTLLYHTDKELIASLVQELAAKQIRIYQVHTVKNDLESIFMDLVKS